MKKITTLLADDKKSRILIPLLTIAMSVVVASIMLLMLGKNPIAAFAGFLQGCGLLPKPTYGNGKGMITDLLSFLGIMAPMLLASLGVAIGMQTGLFNIGVSGRNALCRSYRDSSCRIQRNECCSSKTGCTSDWCAGWMSSGCICRIFKIQI